LRVPVRGAGGVVAPLTPPKAVGSSFFSPPRSAGFWILANRRSHPPRLVMSAKCPKCGKSVYPNDPKINLDGSIYHKECAKCEVRPGTPLHPQ
jgi:hypothetical protein